MNRTEEIHQLKTELWSAQEERDLWRNRCVERDWTLGIWGDALQGIADASPQSWDWYGWRGTR